MKAVISIEHPAWAWQFCNIINRMNNSKDDDIMILAVDKDGDLDLLKSFGIDYYLMANSTGKNVVEKAALFIVLSLKYTYKVMKYKPDVIIGRASPMLAIASFLTRTPQVIFEDTEISKFSLNICKRVAKKIITPTFFLADLGKTQVRLPMYKELFYLHEELFTPDKEVLKCTNIDIMQPYVLIRFISWNASHDFGRHGLNDMDKIRFVEQIAKEINVYISSEGKIPKELEKYRLIAPFDKIHHVLYFATLVVSEGTTTASEAAVLGTHAVYLNKNHGTTLEQERKYKLLIAVNNQKTKYKDALNVINNMIKNQGTWMEGKEKRKYLLQEMPNPNNVYYEYMEMYSK